MNNINLSKKVYDWLETADIEINVENEKIIKNSGVLDDENQYKKMVAYLDVYGWKDFAELVNEKENEWDEDIYYFEDMTLEEVAKNVFDELYGYDIPDFILDYYIDYKSFAKSLEWEGYYEVSNGVIEIR